MNNLQIVIPMAGNGKRFKDAGYSISKPFIPIDGKPMIYHVVKSLNINAEYTFIVKKEDFENINFDIYFDELDIKYNVLPINYMVGGSVISVLSAQKYFNNDNPLIIVNSDQLVRWDSVEFLNLLKDNDGVIALFKASDAKWSYANIVNDKIVEVAEKIVISDNATVGIYGWKSGKDFIKYANEMIDKNITTNNEFYNCPVYNQAILDNKIIKPFFVEKMIPLGTPEDLKAYLYENNIS